MARVAYRRFVLSLALTAAAPAFAQSTSGDIQSPTEYDSVVRENAEVADAMQGPLEGGWIIAAANGPQLYRLELSATGPGAVMAEGAWRDLAVKPGPVSAGLIAGAGLESGKLVIRFTETGPADPVE
ncbi:MAG: hypothetical protein ACXWVH_08880, partial [Caulobacteraceae bacterium]